MIICMIVFGVMLSSLGELKFVWLGFLLQCAGVVSEAYKNALQQFLLGGTRKMNSITLLYYFAPACTILNLACVIIFEIPKMQTVGFEGVSPWVFLVNGVLCFGLNLASIAVVRTPFSHSHFIHLLFYADQANLINSIDDLRYTKVNVIGRPRYGALPYTNDITSSNWVFNC